MGKWHVGNRDAESGDADHARDSGRMSVVLEYLRRTSDSGRVLGPFPSS